VEKTNASALRLAQLDPTVADTQPSGYDADADELRWQAAAALLHGRPARAQALAELADEVEHHVHALRVAPDPHAPALATHANEIMAMRDRLDARTVDLERLEAAIGALPPLLGARKRAREAVCRDYGKNPATKDQGLSRSTTPTPNRDTTLDDVLPLCGVMRWGKRYGRRMMYRRLCGHRGCPRCGPWVAKQRALAIPEDLALYACELTRAEWGALRRKLNRKRDRGEAGDFTRIPLADERLLIVSDAAIGAPITREQVRDVIEGLSTTAYGNLRSSDAWTPRQTEAPEGFVDEGVVTSSVEWIERKAEQLRIPVRRDEVLQRWRFGSDNVPLTADEDAALTRAAGVVSDAEYWEQMRRIGRGTPGGRTLAARAQREAVRRTTEGRAA
jgi:hypothetical protein